MKTEKREGTNEPLFGNAKIARALQGWTTTNELASKLGIVKASAQNYLKRLAKTRKVQTKLVRQGNPWPVRGCVQGALMKALAGSRAVIHLRDPILAQQLRQSDMTIEFQVTRWAAFTLFVLRMLGFARFR